MSRRLLPLVMILAIASGACSTVLPESPVYFVVQDVANEEEDPLALVVGIHSGGRMTLNEIETGTLREPQILTEKLSAIFVDRKRSSIANTEILIEMDGTVAFDDVNALIGALKKLNPSRITVVAKLTDR